jgi:hypothetical protein
MLGGLLGKILPTAINVGKGLLTGLGGPLLATAANVLTSSMNPTPASVNKEIPETPGYVSKQAPTTIA